MLNPEVALCEHVALTKRRRNSLTKWPSHGSDYEGVIEGDQTEAWDLRGNQ